jgi:anti-sigma B factor antagonist
VKGPAAVASCWYGATLYRPAGVASYTEFGAGSTSNSRGHIGLRGSSFTRDWHRGQQHSPTAAPNWHIACPSQARSLRFHSSGGAMSFQTSKENDVVVVDVDGQLIVGNRQELKQKVLDELEGGERKFLIDFTNTGYIDSSGLGVLVSLSKKIREQSGELRLANLNEDLRTLFELTKLDTLFSIADTRDEALASF